MKTTKWQARAVCGCLVAGQIPCAQV